MYEMKQYNNEKNILQTAVHFLNGQYAIGYLKYHHRHNIVALIRSRRMNVKRQLRRKLLIPIVLLFLVAVLWYSILLFEVMIRLENTDAEDMNLYDVKLRKAIESIDRPTREHIKPLQPPNDHDINSGSFYFINSELEKSTENINNYSVTLAGSNEERNKKDEEMQIKPPLREFPNVGVLVKEGLGEGGEPVNISKRLLNEKEQEEYKNGWKNNAFNEYLSNRISLDRTLKDQRIEKCKLIKYPENLPDVSVIVTFHNEAWSVLLRSIHSIINRTPKHLLKEVILADDWSDMPHLGEPLEKYLEDYPKVKIVRATSREGLVRARLRGYRVATGTVLVFLDSHIECAEGWIEPMLDRIKRNWTTVVTPCIDIIDDDTFGFRFQGPNDMFAGGFDWKMVFNWHSVPEKEQKRRNYEVYLPYRSPTMAGGLFAISRAYFTYIGTYDDGMDIWGGENLEISFRIWMCGGTLETTPCSHVGHIFRKRSPYKWRKDVDVLRKNNIRLCEVWLDEYKQYYYDKIGIHSPSDYGNITSRIELRKKLKCKSFEWFLKNVYPEMWVPGESLAYGQIAAKTQPFCLKGDCEYGQTGKPISLVNCSSGHNDNTLYHVFSQKCLEISQDGQTLSMNTCLGTDHQIWLWNRGGPQGPTRNWNSLD
ncbi:GALNT [Mytilus edulis]|uniref:Polypeptide N-acetylgalactosaminyltransferase n=1 Tax=Mytilus edulis TaxID=6550 RepID=A0A8S3SQ66_MYTED|nr:GALNT [Mytilus edulis]